MAVFDCSDSNAWPVIDAIWAGLNGIGAASAAGDDKTQNRGQIIGVGLAWLAVSGISAIYGFSKVSQCKDAKQQRDEQHLGGGAATPPPAPPSGRSAPAAPGGAPPAATPAPAITPVPTTSVSPSRSHVPLHPAVRSSPSRSLAMRRAFVAD